MLIMLLTRSRKACIYALAFAMKSMIMLANNSLPLYGSQFKLRPNTLLGGGLEWVNFKSS